MVDSDLEALVSPKIRETILAAIEKIGEKDFLEIAGLLKSQLDSIISEPDSYVKIGLLTLASQINKSHGDPDTSHSSITESLKGTTIRMERAERAHMTSRPPRTQARPFKKRTDRPEAFYEKRTFKLLGFSANTLTFLILGYFLGGLALSPLTGQQPCTGVTFSPLALSPCIGSVFGILLGAIGGLGYTYYYFVRKM